MFQIKVRKIIQCLIVATVVFSLMIFFFAEQLRLRMAIEVDEQRFKLKHYMENADSQIVPTRILKGKGEITNFEVDGHSPYWFEFSGVSPKTLCTTPTRIKRAIHKESIPLKEFQSQVETTILYAFSPAIEEHVEKMFPSHITNEQWFAVYPFQVACIPKIFNLFCAVRVWFKLDRFQTFTNRYQDSYIYTMELDKHMKFVINSGRLINIPSPIQETHYTGPEDPRLLVVNSTFFLNFINSYAVEGIGGTFRRQFLWSIDKSQLFDVKISDFLQNNFEKNWTPWVVDNNLYFFYQLMPNAKVLHCKLPGLRDKPQHPMANCSFVQGQMKTNKSIDTGRIVLRGGSPFVQYKGDYYIAITHSVQKVFGGRCKFVFIKVPLWNPF